MDVRKRQQDLGLEGRASSAQLSTRCLAALLPRPIKSAARFDRPSLTSQHSSQPAIQPASISTCPAGISACPAFPLRLSGPTTSRVGFVRYRTQSHISAPSRPPKQRNKNCLLTGATLLLLFKSTALRLGHGSDHAAYVASGASDASCSSSPGPDCRGGGGGGGIAAAARALALSLLNWLAPRSGYSVHTLPRFRAVVVGRMVKLRKSNCSMAKGDYSL